MMSHGNGDIRRGVDRADLVDAKIGILFSSFERAGNGSLGEYKWRALRGDGPQVRIRRRRDHGADARIDGRRLQSHRGAERVANQDDVIRADLIEHPTQIEFFVVTVGAMLALGNAMRARIVGNQVESTRHESDRRYLPRYCGCRQFREGKRPRLCAVVCARRIASRSG